MADTVPNTPDRPSLADSSSIDQRDIPDMRRDAIEEAAETSPEARARFARLDRVEADADPALARTEEMKG